MKRTNKDTAKLRIEVTGDQLELLKEMCTHEYTKRIDSRKSTEDVVSFYFKVCDAIDRYEAKVEK